MKKIILPFVISILLLATTSFWFHFSNPGNQLIEYLHFIVIMLLVGFGLYVAVDRLRSRQRNEPVEDELSKLILSRSSSISYYISLYIWVAILFLKDRVALDMEMWIGMGILSMAVTFAVVFLILKFKGMTNDK